MSSKELLFLEEVAADLQTGKRFYEASQLGIGDYFIDSLIADIESLHLYAGIHGKQFGLSACWLNASLTRFITTLPIRRLSSLRCSIYGAIRPGSKTV